ncbi:MAG: flagellin [Desulfobulbaceae bacterium]|nr:flagellin [Desulfobulbaceae bacterium]
MSLRINTNVSAMFAHRSMTQTDGSLGRSLERLSSGLRINRAADDASGMAIADSLKAQGAGIGQAIRNSNDGIAVIQMADGALEESSNIITKIRTLAVQAASDTQNTSSRTYIQSDIDALVSSLNDISTNTKFNGSKLLDGTFTTKKIQIGAYTGESLTVSIATANANALSIAALSVSTATGAGIAISRADKALSTLAAIRSGLGSAQNQLESTVRNISMTKVNVAAAESSIRDVDFADESSNFAKFQILSQSGSFALSQANASQQNVLSLLQ